MSLRVPLTLACWDYDRTLPLAQGDVRPAGVDLTYLTLPVEETFFRMARFREFEAAELSLSSYVLSLDQDAPFVAIPVFPSRAFRHNGIYVHAASGITEPAELAGRLVGVPEYQLTAAVWIRGILAERHGLPVASVRYRTGGLHQPGRTDKIAHNAPPGVEIAPIPAGQTLAGPVAAGGVRGSQGADRGQNGGNRRHPVPGALAIRRSGAHSADHGCRFLDLWADR
jgi:4,5-dihydroxyphthalate decarboxylase